jgi:hypothetical protein
MKGQKMSDNRKLENAKLMRDIAKGLDAKLDDRQHDHGGSIIFPNGAKIFVRLPYYPDNKMKGEVSGSWPQNEDGRAMSAAHWRLIKYNEKNPCEMGFSVLKPVETIVKDIKRRLLPVFFPMWEQAQAELVKAMERKKEHAKLLKELSEACGVKIYDHDKESFCGYFRGDTEAMYIKTRVNYGLSVEISLSSLTGDQAKRIFKMLEQEQGR